MKSLLHMQIVPVDNCGTQPLVTYYRLQLHMQYETCAHKL
jgi:hypothetical protein